MERIHIWPRAGRSVRMPEGGHLPEEGLEVETSLFWQRRIADGDVVVAPLDVAGEAPAPAAPPAKPSKKGADA